MNSLRQPMLFALQLFLSLLILILFIFSVFFHSLGTSSENILSESDFSKRFGYY